MPSPVGHALAGTAIAWGMVPRASRGVTLACVGLAAAADLDLVVPHGHRMASHSVGAVALVTILTIAVTAKVTPRFPVWVAAACIAAYASHLLLDWMAADPRPPHGIQALWPFTDAWYISGWDLFRGTARNPLLTPESMRINLLAIGQEILMLGPIAWLMWRVRRTG